MSEARIQAEALLGEATDCSEYDEAQGITLQAQGHALLAIADAVEDLVAVVRESVRVPVVFNITGEKISHEQGARIAEQLKRLLNPATVRNVDLS